MGLVAICVHVWSEVLTVYVLADRSAARGMVCCQGASFLPRGWFSAIWIVCCYGDSLLPRGWCAAEGMVCCRGDSFLPRGWFPAKGLVSCQWVGFLPRRWCPAEGLVSCRGAGEQIRWNFPDCTQLELSYGREKSATGVIYDIYLNWLKLNISCLWICAFRYFCYLYLIYYMFTT